jgi:hypothetical protein
VVKPNLLLIFKIVLNYEEDNYKDYERKQDPDNALVVFFVQFFILSVRKGDNDNKSDEK